MRQWSCEPSDHHCTELLARLNALPVQGGSGMFPSAHGAVSAGVAADKGNALEMGEQRSMR